MSLRTQRRRVKRAHKAWWSLRRWYGHADLYRNEDYAGLLCTGPYLTRARAARALDSIAARLRGAA